MKKPLFEKQVHFQGSKVLEVNKQNLDEDSSSSTDAEEGTCSRIRTLTTSPKHEFPYHKVPTQVLVVNVLLLPAKYFRQIPQKDGLSKNKVPIEEGVKAEDILNRMLEGEMKVTPKELWAVAPKLWVALKEILMSKRSVRDESNQDLETDNNQSQQKLVSVNSLEKPERRQEIIKIENGDIVEVWAVADPVLQFLEKLSPEEQDCQVFAIEEKEKVEKSAPDMAHLRVVPAIVNGVSKEEVLLDSRSQIVSMTKKVAAANKVAGDPNLSIQMQNANGSLSRTYRLARNVLFMLEGVTVLLQVHIMEEAPCYESPREERVSHAFTHLISNIKSYNGVKI